MGLVFNFGNFIFPINGLVSTDYKFIKSRNRQYFLLFFSYSCSSRCLVSFLMEFLLLFIFNISKPIPGIQKCIRKTKAQLFNSHQQDKNINQENQEDHEHLSFSFTFIFLLEFYFYYLLSLTSHFIFHL